MSLTILLGAATILGLAVLWLFTARPISLLIDRVSTVSMGQLPASPVGWNGTFLQFGASLPGLIGPNGWEGHALLEGGHILDLQGPGDRDAATLTIGPDGCLRLAAQGRTILLGCRSGDLPGADGPIPAYAAQAGDKVSLRIEHSRFSWPTPFETNFMTGQTASKRRGFYYRLSWTKASGQRLDLLWRFEQGFDKANGWTAAGPGGRPAGLIRVKISSP
jgi:hypothetical protein